MTSKYQKNSSRAFINPKEVLEPPLDSEIFRHKTRFNLEKFCLELVGVSTSQLTHTSINLRISSNVKLKKGIISSQMLELCLLTFLRKNIFVVSNNITMENSAGHLMIDRDDDGDGSGQETTISVPDS